MLLHRRGWLVLTFAMVLSAWVSAEARAASSGDKKGQKQAQTIMIVLLMSLPTAAVATVGGLGLHACYRATCVHRSERIAEVARIAPIRCLVLGTANTAVLCVLMSAFGGPAPVLSVAVLVLLVTMTIAGLAAKSENLGVRVARAAGHDCNPIIGLAIGWPIAVSLLLFPVVGWCVFIYLTLSGVGAVVLSYLLKPNGEAEIACEQNEPEADETPTEEPAEQ